MATQHTASWRGAMTALATPMTASGAIDWTALDALIDRQLVAGIHVLVANGSTSEAATLDTAERRKLLAHVVRRKGLAKVMAGTGASATHDTVEAQKVAADLGADAALVVTPPYNRPPLRGLVLHYQAVAKATSLPIFLYNVPSRAGLALSVSDIAELARIDQVIGLKDADADLRRVTALRARLGPGFRLLSGDDDSAAAYVALGGDGVISVASNVVPAAIVELQRAAMQADKTAWPALQAKLAPLLAALGKDANPIPIKAALAALAKQPAYYRLPLCPLEPAVHREVKEALASFLQASHVQG